MLDDETAREKFKGGLSEILSFCPHFKVFDV